MSAALPRDTTHQSEGVLVGEIARVIHRVTGAVIIVFVVVHVIGQAALHAPLMAAMKPMAEAGYPVAQRQHWIHALLYASIVFHTLYGLRLVASEVGLRINYRSSLWGIIGISAVVAAREVVRYVG